MNLTVKTLSGRSAAVTLSPPGDLSALKLAEEEELGHPPEAQRLLFNGAEIKQGDLKGIADGSVIHLMLEKAVARGDKGVVGKKTGQLKGSWPH